MRHEINVDLVKSLKQNRFEVEEELLIFRSAFDVHNHAQQLVFVLRAFMAFALSRLSAI
jgi:hypothetical protein